MKRTLSDVRDLTLALASLAISCLAIDELTNSRRPSPQRLDLLPVRGRHGELFTLTSDYDGRATSRYVRPACAQEHLLSHLSQDLVEGPGVFAVDADATVIMPDDTRWQTALSSDYTYRLAYYYVSCPTTGPSDGDLPANCPIRPAGNQADFGVPS